MEGKGLENQSGPGLARKHSVEPVRPEAQPEPVDVDIRRSAVIVVDMQNAFIKN
jgi:hypothetical protein